MVNRSRYITALVFASTLAMLATLLPVPAIAADAAPSASPDSEAASETVAGGQDETSQADSDLSGTRSTPSATPANSPSQRPAGKPSPAPSASGGYVKGPRRNLALQSRRLRARGSRRHLKQTSPDPWSVWTSGRVSHQITADIASRPAVEADRTSFFDKTIEVDVVQGQTVFLANKADGSGAFNVDDEIILTVTHEDGSSSVFSHDFSGGCGGLSPSGPFDIASKFESGTNSVAVRMRDRCGGSIGSWTVWLVTNGVSAGQTIGSCGRGRDAANRSDCLSDPVNTATGAFVTSVDDLSLPGLGIPFRLTRSYTSFDTTQGSLGTGWTHNLGASLTRQQDGSLLYRGEDGQQLVFTRNGCGYIGPQGTISSLNVLADQSTTSYAQEIAQDNPVAHWRLSDTTSTASDASSNQINGTYNGNPVQNTPGIVGGAVALDGNGDYVSVANQAALNPQHITLEAWAKSNTTFWNNHGWILSKRGQYLIHPHHNERKVTFSVALASGGGLDIPFSPADITQWHHYVGTFDGTTARFYIDGQLVGSATTPQTTLGAGSGLNLNLGADAPPGNPVRYGNGLLDEVAIYPHALSATRVAAHHQAAVAPCPIETGFEVVRSDQSKLRFDASGRLVSHLDRNGKGLSFTYTGGKLSQVQDAAGRSVTFTHNAAGLLTRVELADGRLVEYAYTDGRLTSVTDVRGGATTYTYNPSGWLTKIVDQDGHTVIENVYATNGRVTQQTDALGKISTFAWDATTGTATMTDARGKQWKDIYVGNILKAREDPLGNRTRFKYDSDLNIAKVIDPRGNATVMTYDDRGNMLTRTAPSPLSHVETFVYDSSNNLTSYTDGRNNTTTYSYDTAGNLTSITRPGSIVTTFTRDASNEALIKSITDPRGKVTAFDHDSSGNVTKITAPGGGITTLTYDGSGRVTKSVEPRGNASGANPADYETLFAYDEANHLVRQTDPLGNAMEWTYGLDGRLTSKKDAKNRVTSYGYDAAHRLVSVTAPDSTITTYTYDDAGNLTSRSDANSHATTYAYDDANRLKTVTTPTSQVWSYSYDASGNLAEVVDAAGNLTTADPSDGKTIMSYDVLSRLIGIDYSDSTPDATFSYDANGNRTEMTDGVGTETYAYDALDRLTTVTRGTDVFSYEYNAGSAVTKRTYPDGTAVDYSYDDDGLMAAVTAGLHTTSYAYDIAGNLVTTTLPSGNGHVETRSYDRAGRLSSLVNAKGPLTLSKALYTYDAVSNPLSVETLTGTTTYSYDALDRLTEACFPPGCPGGVGPDVVRYTYDAVGNRLTEFKPSATTTHTYDASDQIQSSETGGTTKTYAHDANGNLTSDGVRSFTYDLAGRMKSATSGSDTTSYVYDGEGKRLQATAGATTKFLWDPNHALPMLARESDGTGALLRRYTYGNGLVSTASGGAESFFHRDGLGSITDVTSASGAPQWSYSYEPFGSSRSATKIDVLNAPDNPMRFTGEYLDPTGLYHLRARQYEAGLGRFTALDPWPALTMDPHVSAYVYVNNRSTVLVDPSGRFGIVGAVVGGVIGGVSGAVGSAISGGSAGDIIKSGVTGAVGGAIVGGTAGLAPLAGAAVGGGANVAGQLWSGTSASNINWGSAAMAAGFGAGGAWVGGQAAGLAGYMGANAWGQATAGGLAELVGPIGVGNMILGVMQCQR